MKYLKSEGFKQCKNDVCMFRHPVTRVKVLVWVDDNFARGVRRHTDAFWKKVHTKFGLKSFEYLETGVSRTFLGLNFLTSEISRMSHATELEHLFVHTDFLAI